MFLVGKIKSFNFRPVPKSTLRILLVYKMKHFHILLGVAYYLNLEKEMATYSSVLAWRIPGTGEPGGLPSMGSHGVGHD